MEIEEENEEREREREREREKERKKERKRDLAGDEFTASRNHRSFEVTPPNLTKGIQSVCIKRKATKKSRYLLESRKSRLGIASAKLVTFVPVSDQKLVDLPVPAETGC